MAEVYHASQREPVATYPRSSDAGRYSTLNEHMPDKHQKARQWNTERLAHWAAEIGLHIVALAKTILASRQHPQQAFRACLGILRLAGKYPHTQMESACQIAHEARTLNYRGLKALLDTLPAPATAETPPFPAHENISGTTYYR